MLKELRTLRDDGFAEEFLMRYAEYRHEYALLPLSERIRYDFDYYLRMKYVEYLRGER